jgi:hypothetical protein
MIYPLASSISSFFCSTSRTLLSVAMTNLSCFPHWFFLPGRFVVEVQCFLVNHTKRYTSYSVVNWVINFSQVAKNKDARASPELAM